MWYFISLIILLAQVILNLLVCWHRGAWH